ncbi:MAG: structural protein P5 [Prevotella sp.]|nr:structural protein P5 [Prevotella sp.]
MKQARGLRNNNPLNIIKSKNQVWLGQTNLGGETRFCQFVSAQYGFRAALKLLRTYYTKYGCTTIRQIICRWAPETENQVEAYIKTVCKLTHLSADAPLPPMKAETRIVWCDLVLAMASVECGLSADDRDTLRDSVGKAWNMLF